MAFTDKLKSVAKNISDKTSSAVETSKQNQKIKAEKAAIEACVKQIGEFIYEQYQQGEAQPEAAAALCEQIDAHNAAIEEAKAEIERIKTAETAAPEAAPVEVAVEVAVSAPEGAICPGCGSENLPGTKFCNNCGEKLAADKRVCECGAEVAVGVKFCGSCGAKFE